MVEFLEKLFSPLINLFGSGLEFFYSLGAPWWLSIVMLTFIVRSLLFPLTIKQVKSMRAVQDLKPEMEKIRAKYKDNKQKQQEEIMKMYQERQVNPLGGCFPILVQMPVFITMYYVIRTFDQTHAGFSSGGMLWFKDLTVADPYYILPVLSAVSMLAASEITSKRVDPQQRWIMRVAPVGITVVLLHFPAGLFMYWITSNLVTLVQNYLIYNHKLGRSSSATDGREVPVDKGPEPSPAPASRDSDAKAEQQKAKRASRRRRRKKR